MSLDALMGCVRRALEAAELFHAGARLLCAVSGGADSVALLHALSRLRAQGGYTLAASHVQHGLRGQSSADDEAFVRALCRELDVPLYVEDAGLMGGLDAPGMEARARESRRRIFRRQMDALRMDAVLLAHHRDDQAETVLLRLLRGAGMDGLRGMRPAAPFGCGVMLRPLLDVPRGAIREALASEGLAHREDESNQSPLTPRNALRLQTLPALEKWFPGAAERIALTAEALEEDGRYLDAEAARLYEAALAPLPPLHALWRDAVVQAPAALARRVARRWFWEGAALAGPLPHERALNHADTLALAALLRARPGAAINLPCGLKAVAGPRLIHLLRQSGEALGPVPPPLRLPLDAGCGGYEAGWLTLVQTAAEAGGPVPAGAGEAVLAARLLKQGPVLRRPLAADCIRPLGAPGHKPLRRFLTDRGVDLLIRPWVTVLAVENEVLWIPGLCASEALRLSAVPEGAVRLAACGGTPWLHHT